jgi:hypothetical protein
VRTKRQSRTNPKKWKLTRMSKPKASKLTVKARKGRKSERT